MVLAPFVALLLAQSVPIAQLDALAQAKDVDGLNQYVAQGAITGRNPLQVLRTGGTYGTGRFGWHAFTMKALDASAEYVVFSTPLTSEDIGEILFEARGGKLSRYIPETEDGGWTIRRNDLEVTLDPAAKKAAIKDTISLDRQANATGLLLRLGPNYTMRAVSDDQAKPLAFVQAGGVVWVNAPTAASSKITVSYDGIVDKPQYAGSIDTQEAMLTNDAWYPMVGRKPAPYEVIVHSPRNWTTVGQGELVSVKEAGPEKITRWRMDLPVIIYSLSSAPYRMSVQRIRGKRYTVWSTQLSDEQMHMQTELYPSIIEFYERFAKFPFSGYGAVVSSKYGGGALEAYSFATYGGFPGEDAHEPSHTWWGGIINNSYLKSLWNESFADFSDGLYRRNVEIGSVKERAHAFIQTPSADPAYNAAPLADSGAFIGPAASSLGYGKGAFVLQMLEDELGTTKMIDTMRQWIQSHPTDRGGEWEDYEAVVNRIAGRDMSWFFDQWLRRTGVADFDVSDVRWESGKVTGTVTFKGKPYRINAEIMLEYPDGKRDFSHFDTMQTPSGAGYRFSVDCSRRPSLVSIDPWRRILRPIQANETPAQVEDLVGSFEKYTDTRHPDWLANVGGGQVLSHVPSDLNGKFIVGSPESLPILRSLCAKAGFKVTGTTLTYDGSTLDLTSGCALAVVDLGDGNRCVIGLGKTRLAPSVGRAKVALTDSLGRFIRGETEPKTSGFLTFRL